MKSKNIINKTEGRKKSADVDDDTSAVLKS